MTLGAYLPLVLVVAAAFVLSTRAPSGGFSRDDTVRDVTAAAVMVVAVALLISGAGWLLRVQCPGGLDAAGKCVETSSLDLTAVGILGGVLAVGVAAALLLQTRSGTVAIPRAVGSPRPGPQPRVSSAPAPSAVTEPARRAPKRTTAFTSDEPAGTVDGKPYPLRTLIDAAARAVGSRPGVVFSPFFSDEALDELATTAEVWSAQRYVTSEDGAPGAMGHNGLSAARIAGEDAGHLGELALEVAGGAIDSVFFADARVALSPLAIERLHEIGSVCLAAADAESSEVSERSRVVIRVRPWNDEPGHWSAREGERHPLQGTAEPTRAEIIARIRTRSVELASERS